MAITLLVHIKMSLEQKSANMTGALVSKQSDFVGQKTYSLLRNSRFNFLLCSVKTKSSEHSTKFCISNCYFQLLSC